MSDPIEVDTDVPHHLSVQMGSLYPPSQHPFFADKSEFEKDALTRWLKLELDGRPVIAGVQPFFESSPGSIQIGHTTCTNAYGEHFTGQILKVERGRIEPLKTSHGSYGAVTLSLIFPPSADTQPQPLVSAGVTGRADTLYVHSVGEGKVRFGYDHWGVGRGKAETFP